MKLEAILALADKAYPDAWILRHWDAKARKPLDRSQGDTLALFIVNELRDAFEPGKSDLSQLKAASQAMANAMLELDRVNRAFIKEVLALRAHRPLRPRRGRGGNNHL